MRKNLLILSALFLCFAGQAQTVEPDSSIVVGKLANGLTYYIAHNDNPQGCAEFYIAHNVGALQEDDSQDGLAHFLEHMAFNGTENYPGKELLNFLAKDGVRFGYNVNAYTSRNETVYNISVVPLVRESFVDSVLMVLHDWSCAISCEQQALDDERGVIKEEWRLADESRRRMMMRQSELIYKGSKQAERTVLGSMDVISNFKREDILSFYQKWYRPDLQAVVIVGDFDTADMESRVRRLLSDIPAAENPTPKQRYMPAPQSEPLFEDMTDPQIRYNAFKIIYKSEFPSREELGTVDAQKNYFARAIVSSIMNDRLRKRVQQKDCPLSSAVCVSNTYDPDYYITMFTISPKGVENQESALEICDREILRMKRFGISRDEFEVAKLGIAARLHLDKDMEQETVLSKDVVTRCVQNFLRGYPLVRPDRWAEIQKEVLESLEYENTDAFSKRLFDTDEVIYSNCVNVDKKDKVPSEGRIREILADNQASELTPEYLEYPELRLEVDATPGRIISSGKFKGTDISVWTLSNGARVYFRQAQPMRSDIHLSMTLSFDTGYRAFDQEKIDESRAAYAYLRRNLGIRGCDRSSYKNYPSMSGIFTIVGSPSTRESLFRVSARAEKAEDAFRVTHLQFTEPYFLSEKDLSKYVRNELSNLSKPEQNRTKFGEEVEHRIYGNHAWMHKLDSSAYEKLDIDLVREVYERCYTDFGNLSVYICSDLPESRIREYVEKYIASFEGNYGFKKGKYLPILPSYSGNNDFYRSYDKISAPLSEVECRFLSKVRLNTANRLKIDILDYIMSARYLDLIREKRGGAYHVSFSTAAYSTTGKLIESGVSFQTRPELRDLLVGDVYEELERMCQSGPSQEEMELAVKYLRKHHAEREAAIARSTGDQLEQMMDYIMYGKEYDYDFDAQINKITAADIRNLARSIASGSRLAAIYTEE